MSNPQEPYPQQQPRLPHSLPPLPERLPQQPQGQDGDGGGQPGGRRRARAARAQGRTPGKPRPMVLLAGAGGLVLLVALGILIAVNVTGSTSNQARGLAEGFTELVIAGDTAKAYREYLDPALQEQLSKEQFMTGIGTLKLDRSCEPAFSEFTVDNDGGGRRADVTGLITCGDRKTDLSYRFEGADQLKMTSITLRPAD